MTAPMDARESPRLVIRPTPAALTGEWVQTWKILAGQAHAQNKNFCVALAGGSTPKQFYAALAEASAADELPWDRVHLFWGDERCVPPEHPESNYRMAHETLLSRVAIPEKNVHRMQGENLPDAEASRYAEELRQWLPLNNGVPQFDWVLLGMGADGHTASLFPGQNAVLDAVEVCAVAQHPESGQQRLTLTLPVLNHAKKVSVLVTGSEKAVMVGRVLQDPESRRRYPAARVNGKQVEWWLDREAASHLKSD